jgi:type IV pilus assembly protein PilC
MAPRKNKNEEAKIPDWAKVTPGEPPQAVETPPVEAKESPAPIQKPATQPIQKRAVVVPDVERPVKKPWWKRDVGESFLSVSIQEQILFARHLSLMAKAGMSILDSINLLREQSRSRSMKVILADVSKSVSNGQFLSVALEPYKRVFGELFINIVRIGENSGTLSENLIYLAEELTKKRQLRSKVTGALVYPAIIMIGVIGVVSFLVFFLFPKILPVFETLNVKLPLSTRILIGFANFATEYTVSIILGLISFGIAFWAILKIRQVRWWFHRILIATPVLGGMVRSVNMASFARTLAILLRSGSKIIESIGTTANTLENLVYRDALMVAGESVRKGEQLSSDLKKYPRLFPLMLVQMISVGESTGNLSETLQYLGGFYEEEIDNTTKNLSTVLEPLLLITMGVIVGFVAIAIITPIYGITQGVK